MDSFRSFQNPEECQRLIAPALLPWSVIESTDGRDRLPFRQTSVEVKNFVHHGREGDLILQFLDDRLRRVMFYPDEPEAYLVDLKTRAIVPAPEGGRPGVTLLHEPAGHAQVEIVVATDYTGKRYVAWSDRRLEREYHDLIAKYS
jgi:hypothetical protein